MAVALRAHRTVEGVLLTSALFNWSSWPAPAEAPLDSQLTGLKINPHRPGKPARGEGVTT